jgi:two-component system, OmpR family, response regulator
MRILVIEPDLKMAGCISRQLSPENLDVHVADGLESGLAFSKSKTFDIIIVALQRTGACELSLVGELRSSLGAPSILALISGTSADERVACLGAGADDCLCKPFAIRELQARVRALSRRSAVKIDNTVLRVADLELNAVSRLVARAGQEIVLQNLEFKLLEFLMRQDGRVIAPAALLRNVWNLNSECRTTLVATHISRLRAKIDRPFSLALVQTVRHVGYSVRAPL